MALLPAEIGSISTGTLRAEDLFPAFYDKLEECLDAQPELEEGDEVDPEVNELRYQAACILERAYPVKLEDPPQGEQPRQATHQLTEDQELLSELVMELEDLLQEFAPPYCHFGSLEGDGSDFGFWPCHELINELPTKPDSDGEEDYKEVKDNPIHGNRITVYDCYGNVLLELV